MCVVFHKENASTAVPDLDSPTLGLRDREVFLDRVAYCPVQYALRSLTMNRVGILPFLTPAPNTSPRVQICYGTCTVSHHLSVDGICASDSTGTTTVTVYRGTGKELCPEVPSQ